MKTMKSLIAFGIVLSMLLMHLTIPASAATGTQPVNPNASDEAKELLQLLYNVKGNGIITGMYNWGENPDERTELLRRISGKYAGIWNTDFSYGGSAREAQERHDNIINSAFAHHEAGDIICLMWHQVKPNEAEREGWGSVQGYLSDQEYDLLLTPGTVLNQQYLERIDQVANSLKKLQEAGIPVLWRPYHECDGGWFWWGGKNGGERFIKLWRLMYDRYTNYHGLDNLIWVWNVSHDASTSKMFEYYPGNAYVDVCSVDIYSDQYLKPASYASLKTIADGKPIALGEVGQMPDMNYMEEHYPDYVFFIEWADWLWNGDQPGNDPDAWIRTQMNDSYCYNRGEIPTNLPDVDGPGIKPDKDASEFADLYVLDKGAGYVTIEWKNYEPDAAGYKVFQNGVADPVGDFSAGNGGTLTVSNLKPNTTYYFTLQPYAGAEHGWAWIQNTRNIEVTTLRTNPGEPGIDAIEADDDSIYITMKDVAVDSSNHITVYNSDNNDELVANTDFIGSIALVEGLEGATTYRFVISSRTGAFEDMEDSATTTGIKAYNITTTSISLKWNDFFPAKALYKVLWGSNSRDVYDCNITIDGLEPNTRYSFSVVGVDSNWGWSGGSREISARTKRLEIPAVDSIDVGEYDLQFNLVYVDENGQNHITLYDNDNNKAVVYDADFTGDTVKIEDLSRATSYSYKITSKSNEFSAFTGDTQTAGIRAINVTSDSVTLRWNDFFPAKVLYKVGWEGNYIDVYGLQETIDGLEPDTNYEFTIAAVDANWGWPMHYTYNVRTLPNKNQILSVGNGTVQMQIVDAAALADYTLIVASYDGKELKKVELFNPAASVNYTQVAGTTTKAFLWNMATLQPYAN